MINNGGEGSCMRWTAMPVNTRILRSTVGIFTADAPLDGVLADVDVLRPLHLVHHVLGVLAAGQRRHAPAAAGGVAARARTEPDRQIAD